MDCWEQRDKCFSRKDIQTPCLRTILSTRSEPCSHYSHHYYRDQVWDTVQAFASSVSGSLATAAVLGGLGVGDSAATPLAATITWILKDGAGMVGRIVFAAYTSTSLDFDCKVKDNGIKIQLDIVLSSEMENVC